MLKESIARRYSEALFSLANERGETQQTIRHLDAFVELTQRHADVSAFYASPVIDRGLKEQILRDVLAQPMNELAVNFLILLVRKRRENIVELVAKQMHELLDRQAGRELAAVATPMPLSSQEINELAHRLSQLYKQTIIPQPKVDPALLGGLIVQVGDRYVDDSVAGKLEELRRHLLATADSWATTSPNGKP